MKIPFVGRNVRHDSSEHNAFGYFVLLLLGRSIGNLFIYLAHQVVEYLEI